MKEAFEKIKERLETELKCTRDKQSIECMKNDGFGTPLQAKYSGNIEMLLKAIEIVKQVENECLTNDGWIPVSSGNLPKEGQVVNATILIESQQRRFVTQVMYGSWWLNSDKRMIAWKPLEEPYEGE